MDNILAQFEHVDKTNNLRLGSDGIVETRFTTRSELYRYCLKEYGRCIGKCYVGEGKQIGWVFLKRVKYEDCNDTFLMETWVSVHTAKPTRTVEYHYADF